MKLFIVVVLLVAFAGCKSGTEDAGGSEITEPAQQLGDIVASIDEVGGTGGTIGALERASKKTFARYAPDELEGNLVSKIFIPKAEAVACSANVMGHLNGGFGNCTGSSPTSTKTRNFNSCTVGTDVVFNGSVAFTWTSAASCTVASVNEKVERSPNFTVEGRRGATLTVTRDASYGQRLTLTNATPKTYRLDSDGIRRKFTTSSGTVTTFDYITTATNVVVTGDTRLNRVMNGGTIRVKDNLTQVTCDYSPVNVTWGSSSCNCPTQGSWQATCSDAKTATVTLNGCGTGTFTLGSDSGTVTFDRCGN